MPASAPAPRPRSTQQQRAVLHVLEHEDRPLAPSEVLDLASAQVPGISLTTVYRILKKLQLEARIVAVELPSQPPRYEMAGKGHHHHFWCRRCDRIFELRACSATFSKLVPQGFAVETHEVFLQGRCARCAKAK